MVVYDQEQNILSSLCIHRLERVIYLSDYTSLIRDAKSYVGTGLIAHAEDLITWKENQPGEQLNVTESIYYAQRPVQPVNHPCRPPPYQLTTHLLSPVRLLHVKSHF